METAIALYYFALAAVSIYLEGYIYGAFCLLLAVVFLLVCLGDTSVVLVQGCSCCRKAVSYADKTIPDEKYQTRTTNMLQTMFGARTVWRDRMSSLWGLSNSESSKRSNRSKFSAEMQFNAATKQNHDMDMELGGIYENSAQTGLCDGDSNPANLGGVGSGSHMSYTKLHAPQKEAELSLNKEYKGVSDTSPSSSRPLSSKSVQRVSSFTRTTDYSDLSRGLAISTRPVEKGVEKGDRW